MHDDRNRALGEPPPACMAGRIGANVTAPADLAGILKLAVDLFGTTAAAIVALDDTGSWIAAEVGLGTAMQAALADFASATTIPVDEVVVVPDVTLDPRLAGRVLMLGAAPARFMAWAPLLDRYGQRCGMLVIADTAPRATFPHAARAAIAQMAALAADRVEARHLGRDLGNAEGFVRATQSAVLTTDSTGSITFANPACEALLGYEPGVLIGRNVRVIVPARFHAPHEAGMAALVAGGLPRLAGKSVEVTAVRSDGSEVPIELSLTSWGRGARMGIGAVIRDISERRARDARLLRLAHQDARSGLPNRASLLDALQSLLDRGGTASILALSIDGYRTINDTFGHTVGDALLEALAVRLRGRLAPTATLAQIGTDELAVLMPDQADPLAAHACAQALLSAFADPIRVGDHLLSVGATIGAALAPGDGADAEEAMASADLALHEAKRDGTRNFRLFEAVMRSAASARRAMQDALRLALEQRELELHYQPQVDLASGEICGAEALIRWRHPERGLMAPGEFLPAIETSVLALSVGWWTIDEACRQAAAWRAAGLPPIRVAVNLFAAQLRAGTLGTIVAEALARHGLPPEALELELTEIIALERDEATLQPLRALLARGVGIAFDDFGTGYAALSTIKNFPLTKLKIDRSFVRDILTDRHDAAIVKAMLDLGRGLDLTVVAEGIETEEQERALLAMGCRLVQGFRYGRALQPESFARRLASPLIAVPAHNRKAS